MNRLSLFRTVFRTNEMLPLNQEGSSIMDIKEFIELYINSSDEIQDRVEQILTEAQRQIELQD